MKKIFKVGMKVYDQFVFPGKEGRVLKIVEGESFPIKVTLGDPKILWSYTKDGRYGPSVEPSLSTSPYSIVGFEQKAIAPEFYEALDWLDNNENYQTVFEDERTYPSKEICESSEALRKLIILREYYNEGWKPDWKGKDPKYTIENCECELFTDTVFNFSKVMAFKSEKIRDRFLEDQRELLETAKPLL